MVGIGIVGIGFMGMIHYLAARKVEGAKVAAICSRDPKKLAGDWSSIQGNFGPRGTQMDLSGQEKYSDFDLLLADPNVELVDLCVPNDEHTPLAIRALNAGKHVLVEKPIALTNADADAMVAAAKASGKLLMVAHVLPFFPEFACIVEASRSGKYGKLEAAHLTRIIAKADWSAGIADAARSGGPAIDLHIHDTHFIGLVCGIPKAVHSRGVVRDGAVVHVTSQYIYDNPNLAVSAVSGALSQPGRTFTHAFEFNFEKATLSFGSANFSTGVERSPLSVILPDSKVERPQLGSADPIDSFALELAAAVESVKTGIPHPTLSVALARQALAICHAEVESVRSQQTIEIS